MQMFFHYDTVNIFAPGKNQVLQWMFCQSLGRVLYLLTSMVTGSHGFKQAPGYL